MFIDGCNNRALQGGDGTGFDPKHPGKRGWKFVIATDAVGMPIAFSTDAANRNDYPLMFDVLDDLHTRDQLRLVGEFHADRGFNYNETPDRLATDYGIEDFRAPARNNRTQGRKKRSPAGPAGSSKQPTHGYATTANSPTTPTANPNTARPHSASRSPSCSSTESVTPNTALAPYPLTPLAHRERRQGLPSAPWGTSTALPTSSASTVSTGPTIRR
jgi:hypothetical protein